MTNKSRRALVSFAALTILFFGSSATARTFKGYEGADLPKSEVSTVKLVRSLILIEVNSLRPRKPRRGASISVQAGTQRLKVGTKTGGYRDETDCTDGSHRSLDLSIASEMGGHRLIEFNVEAGHVYTISSQFVRAVGATKSTHTYSGYDWQTQVFDDTEQRPVDSKIEDNFKLFGSCTPVN